LRLFKKNTYNQDCIGVQFNDNGLAIVLVQAFQAEQPRVNHCEWLAEPDADRQESVLARSVEQAGLKHRPCNLVLASQDYNLLLVEAPKVAPEELREALRWRVRDLIDFPVEEAVLDAFLLPEDRTRGAKRMAYVAVARRELIARRVAQIQAAQLRLEAIDIPELALRNLILRCCDTERGVALVKLMEGGGSLHIVRGEDLHLARRFNLPYKAGLLDDLPAEALILELQRSLDYFERQMRQAPPGQLVMAGENVSADKLTPEIQEGLPASASLFDPTRALSFTDQASEPLLPLCYEALGAALRQPEQAGESEG